VDKLVSAAYENGLLPETLSNAVELLTTPGYLDQASLGAIARNLYPAAAVSGDIILQVIGALGHGQLKPALSIQAILLRWIVMVYHLVDTPGVLSQAYAVLFNLLDTAAIR
jgi:centromere protein I